jgi:uncharacterized protein YdaU (DUF1376 family)
VNFFKLYIGDYQRDTAHLSVTEHGAYMLMLQHYYATEKPLPVGKALHRMLRAQDKEEREAIDSVAAQFWTTTDAGLVNERADRELTKAGDQKDTNRRIALEREAARKASRDEHDESTKRATNDQPNQTPDTRHQVPTEVGTARGKRAKRPAATLMPDGFAVSDAVQRWATDRGFGQLSEHLDAFRRKAKAKGYTYVDWDAAFMEAVREDWAKLRTGRNGSPMTPELDLDGVH